MCIQAVLKRVLMGFPIVNGNGYKRLTKCLHGFTLIELMITLSIMALLVSLVAPRYFKSVDRARDQVLIHQLAAMREAIEQYYADKGYYPESLEALVKERYLKHIPVDPITDRATWVMVPAPVDSTVPGTRLGISDIHSSSAAQSLSGQPYNAL